MKKTSCTIGNVFLYRPVFYIHKQIQSGLRIGNDRFVAFHYGAHSAVYSYIFVRIRTMFTKVLLQMTYPIRYAWNDASLFYKQFSYMIEIHSMYFGGKMVETIE